MRLLPWPRGRRGAWRTPPPRPRLCAPAPRGAAVPRPSSAPPPGPLPLLAVPRPSDPGWSDSLAGPAASARKRRSNSACCTSVPSPSATIVRNESFSVAGSEAIHSASPLSDGSSAGGGHCGYQVVVDLQEIGGRPGAAREVPQTRRDRRLDLVFVIFVVFVAPLDRQQPGEVQQPKVPGGQVRPGPAPSSRADRHLLPSRRRGRGSGTG